MRAALVLLFTLGSLNAARASADVGVIVVGESTMQPQLVAQLEGWLRTHGHTLSTSPLPPSAITELVDCFVVDDEGCAKKVIDKRSKSSSVVFVQVDLKAEDDKPDQTVTLVAHWFDKGRDAIAERRFCQPCTDATLRTTADELMSALTTTGEKNGGKFRLATTPAGATVRVNGNEIGVTPLEYDLAPGTHRVEITLEGRRDLSREVIIRRGETTQLELAMQSYASKNFFPALFLGTGGVLIATGIVLLVIDEDVPEPVGPQKEFYRNTGPLGVGLMAGGLVVSGIGGYLLFRSKRSSTPVAAATSDGAYLGWAGQF